MKAVQTKNGGWNVYVPTVNGGPARFHFATTEAKDAFLKAVAAVTIVRLIKD
jgi:hypothetical protein